ncbi:MAG TPA: S8 family peptidase [Fimbriimonas sp.]|nr:S8 family peptidase [Fimbriimonas sp.]
MPPCEYTEVILVEHVRGVCRKTKTVQRIAALGLLSLIWGTCFAEPVAAKCDRTVARDLYSSSSKSVRVVVTLDSNPTDAQAREMQSLGFDVRRHLPIISALAGSICQNHLQKLAALPFVKRVSSDDSVRKDDSFTVDHSLASTAWKQYSAAGNGIGVAVIDSGIFDGDPDFNTLHSILGIVPIGHRVSAAVDFTGLGVQDQCGHGTHVGGLIAGDGSQSQGILNTQTFYGIAPGCSLINVRVLDAKGQGTVSNVITAVQWCINNAKKYNIRIINLSMGHPVGESYTTDPLCKAVEQAWKSGIVVVCAAGNGGRLNDDPKAFAPNSGYGTAYWTVESPGNDPYVITVGATKNLDGRRSDDQIASYSSRGPTVSDCILKPDIIAPGNNVISCEDPNHSYLTTTYGTEVMIKNSCYQMLGMGYSKAYFCLSGTSMATPVVSGAAALMLQVNPSLTPDTVKARLMISADKWTDPIGIGDPCTYGAGYLNIPAAIANKVTASTYALSPALELDNDGNVYAILDPSIYGQRAMWGTGSDLQGIYGDRAMWGCSSSTAIRNGRAMWGTGGPVNDDGGSTSSSSLDLSAKSVLANGDK